MKKLNNKSTSIKRNAIYFILLATVISACFLLLVPKVASTIFPQKQKIMLENFIAGIRNTGKLDLRKYWEFREFYSPGYFKYEKTGMHSKSDKQIADLGGLDSSATAQLVFISRKVRSIGGRTPTRKLSLPQKSTGSIILKTPSTAITESGKAYTIIFLKPVSEVRKANGFLQDEKNEDDTHGNYWIEITTIQKN